MISISARTLCVFTLCILLRVYFSCHVRYMASLTDRAVTVKYVDTYFKWILVALHKMNKHHKFFGLVPELCREFQCSLPVDLKFWRILHKSRILWHTQQSKIENGWITCHLSHSSSFQYLDVKFNLRFNNLTLPFCSVASFISRITCWRNFRNLVLR